MANGGFIQLAQFIDIIKHLPVDRLALVVEFEVNGVIQCQQTSVKVCQGDAVNTNFACDMNDDPKKSMNIGPGGRSKYADTNPAAPKLFVVSLALVVDIAKMVDRVLYVVGDRVTYHNGVAGGIPPVTATPMVRASA